MDDELMVELDRIRNLNDPKDTKKAILRVCHYILTLSYAPSSYFSNLRSFIEFACENLPSSNLPMMISRKFGIQVQRKRKVSFGEIKISQIDPESYLSAEGRLQRNRESRTLNIFNTDVFKSFRPKIAIEEGENNTSVIVPIFNKNLENKYCGSLFKNNVKIPEIKFSIDQILENPQLLDKIED